MPTRGEGEIRAGSLGKQLESSKKRGPRHAAMDLALVSSTSNRSPAAQRINRSGNKRIGDGRQCLCLVHALEDRCQPQRDRTSVGGDAHAGGQITADKRGLLGLINNSVRRCLARGTRAWRRQTQ